MTFAGQAAVMYLSIQLGDTGYEEEELAAYVHERIALINQ